MKKVIVILAILLGGSILAHADSTENMPQQVTGGTTGKDNSAQEPAPTMEQKSPASNNADKVDSGSGDDVDTVNDADPANDKDPEADEDSGASSAHPAK